MPREIVSAFLEQTSPEELQKNGPRVDVRISLPEQAAKLRTSVPRPVDGLALVDTGASISCIGYDVANKLELQEVGRETVSSPGAEKEHPVYVVTWKLLGSEIPPFQAMPVMGVNLGGQGLSMLIGRDVLRIARLSYDGLLGRWQINIPIGTLPDIPAPTSKKPKKPADHKTKRKHQRKARKTSRKKG